MLADGRSLDRELNTLRYEYASTMKLWIQKYEEKGNELNLRANAIIIPHNHAP